MSDKRQQQESQMRADLSKRLQEKLQGEQEFIGKVLTNGKEPECKSEKC
jgi:hypothetical protein